MHLVNAIAAAALLAGNFFFVAVEFAVTRMRPTMVAELVERGAPGSRSLKHAVDHIDNYLSACQLGITICSIGLGITAEPLIKDAFERVIPSGAWAGVTAATVSFVIAYLAITMFHVVLGELAPKSLAIARTERTGLLFVPPMRVFYLATKPVVDFLNGLGNLVVKPFGIPPASEAGTAPHSESELRRLIAESREEGELAPEEQAFAEGVFTFGDRRVREVMVPRPAVRWVATDQAPVDAARIVFESGHTRFPVCEPGRGLDAVVGVLHANDLLRLVVDDETPSLAELARPVVRTSEGVLLDELLERLRDERQRLAVVEDEHGTCVGVVTLENVLEEIVGELEDEFDPAEGEELERRDGGLAVAGTAPVRRVAAELGLELDPHHEATIGGYVVERLGRVPAAGERVDLPGWEAEVTRGDEAQVGELLVRRRDDEADTDLDT